MSNFIRQRGFLDPNRLLHAPTATMSHLGGAPGDQNTNLSNTALVGAGIGGEYSSNTQVLWGTNINTTSLQQNLRDFLISFTLPADEENDASDHEMQYNEPHYISLLRQIAETEDYTLDVNCDHIFDFSKNLYKQLEDYPTDVIPIFDLVAL